MKSRWALLVAAPFALTLGSCVSSHVAGTLGTGYVWVATEGDQKVAAYSINENSGAISQVGKMAATGAQPSAMALTPDRKTLFIANLADNTISVYTVNSDGSLAAATGTTSTLAQGPSGCAVNCTLGQNPSAMAVDPNGKFLFVADQGQASNPSAPGGISVFSISGTSLTRVGPGCPANFSQSTCPVVIADLVTGFGTGPSALAVAPNGTFLYVANQFSDTVLGFSYDGNGNLTALPGQAPNPCGAGAPGYCVQTGANPAGLGFSRCAGVTQANANCAAADSNNLFVANSGSNNISIFAACIQVSSTCASANGSLTQVSGSPVAAGIGPKTILIQSEFNFVYAVDAQSNEVSQYSYSAVTGLISPLSPAVASTGLSPFAGAITGDGSYVFVSNNNGSSMSVLKVNNLNTSGNTPTGRLSPGSTPSITLAGQPAAIIAR